uniref:Uncharacterized protein n=1 Tax=Seriola lalandi dorsalis TaxID=1841481 RepID=A0A3B4XHZ1_SERLL
MAVQCVGVDLIKLCVFWFQIIGGVIISLGLLCQILTSYQSVQNRTDALVVFYVVGIITMVIAILGAYGAHKEKSKSTNKNLPGCVELKFRTFLPLDQASDEAKNMMHCCGLFSYTDWESDIPPSCLCDPSEEEQMGACRTIDYRVMTMSVSSRPQPCVPIILHYVLLLLDIVLGVIFSLLALAVLGMILSSIILHQMRYPNRPTVLMTVPTIFTTPPPKYQELHNPPTY